MTDFVDRYLLLAADLLHRVARDSGESIRLAAQAVADALAQDNDFLLFGSGHSGLVARDFSYKLMKIGMAAVTENDMHVLLATVQALGPDDLLFAISFSGTRREINLAAQEALRVGARVMAVTNFAPNELQQYADLTLYTISEQQAQRSGAISSKYRATSVNRPVVYGAGATGLGTRPRPHPPQ